MLDSLSLPLEVSRNDSDSDCGSIGGTPELPAGDGWPLCKICKDEMVLFFDIELPNVAHSPFIPASRLQVFACREHDDISGTIYSDYTRTNEIAVVDQLPPQYWRISDGHYLLRLLAPTTPKKRSKRETRLAQRLLRAHENSVDCVEGLKLFGEPDWLQAPETHTCACGAPMVLILQVPDGFGFEMMPEAPEQEGSFSSTQYCLFLGNQLFLLACRSQCHAQALWPVLQN
jgi:hypothetical protein